MDCLVSLTPELACDLFQVFAALHLDDNGIEVMQAIIFAKCIGGVRDAAKNKHGEPEVKMMISSIFMGLIGVRGK